MWVESNGSILIAYEKNNQVECWIKIRYYKSVSELLDGTVLEEHNIHRSLGPTADGTPSFEEV